MNYEEFHLLATDPQPAGYEGQAPVHFQVRVTHSPAGEEVDGVPAQYDDQDLRPRLDALEAGGADWPDVMELGLLLAQALLPGAVRDLLSRSIDRVKMRGNRLRLRLMLEGDLNNLPWETLLLNRAGGEATAADFLALTPDVSIVRHQASRLPPPAVKARLPAQMLVALSSPVGWPPLAVEEERRVIAAALAGNEQVQVTWKQPASREGLWSGVDQAHLFHFAGHGGFVADRRGAPRGLLVLEDEYGDPQEVEAGELALELRQRGVRVAVLGACRSGRRDAQAWNSVAAALLKADLGAVVAMQQDVHDASATAFASEFYRSLVAGLTIDEAVTHGRIKMAAGDTSGWGTPVLYLRAEDGVVFPEYAADPELEGQRRQRTIEAVQRVEKVHGKLTGVRARIMEDGQVKVIQTVRDVEHGAEVVGVEIEQLGGGSVEVDQTADEVGGDMTGVSLDSLGG
jgi:hypothetical protein